MPAEEVLTFLRINPGWHRVKEISQRIDMACPNVNRHLNSLKSDNDVELKQIRHGKTNLWVNVWQLAM